MSVQPRVFALTGIVVAITATAALGQGRSESLFNGRDLAGWHSDVPAADDKPQIEPSFVVRDGLLVSMGNPRGHLITDASYSNYRLEVEYRFANRGGNCGVLVHASTPRALCVWRPRRRSMTRQASTSPLAAEAQVARAADPSPQDPQRPRRAAEAPKPPARHSP